MVNYLGSRGYGSVAERDLPKVETRVRFPLPAQIKKCAQDERFIMRAIGVPTDGFRGSSVHNTAGAPAGSDPTEWLS